MSDRDATFEARFDSPSFDCSELRVVAVQGREAIGELFRFDVEVAGRAGAHIEPSEALGQPARLVFERGGAILRTVYGIIASVTQTGEISDEATHHVFRLVPRAARLTLLESQDVFLDETPPAIARRKLEAVGIASGDIEDGALLGTYRSRDFVVQYGETDLAFVSRWCEHLGISFYFHHTYDIDRIVFTDSAVGFGTFPGCPKLRFDARADEPEQVRELRYRCDMLPEQFWVTDYDYRQPDLELTAEHVSAVGTAGGVFEYGGHFRSLAEGADLARARAEERESRSRVFEGRSDVCRVSAGHRYQIEGDTNFDGREMLVVSVDHDVRQSVGHVTITHYSNTFTAVAGDQMYRPPRRTPIPRIAGLLTGVIEPKVTGQTEDPACIDEQGRYWVKFMFDTAPLGGRKASKPVRMALPNTGPRSGVHFPLRPGVEVVVAFANGDPDRPVIVGSVHNAKVAPHVVTDNEQYHTIETTTGIRMRFKDTLQRR